MLATIYDEARVEVDDPRLPVDCVADSVVIEPTMPSTWDFMDGLEGMADG